MVLNELLHDETEFFSFIAKLTNKCKGRLSRVLRSTKLSSNRQCLMLPNSPQNGYKAFIFGFDTIKELITSFGGLVVSSKITFLPYFS